MFLHRFFIEVVVAGFAFVPGYLGLHAVGD
jgi:hypothetical protein